MWIWWPQAFKQINCLKHENILPSLLPSTLPFIILLETPCIKVFAVKKELIKCVEFIEFGDWIGEMNVNERVRANVRFLRCFMCTSYILYIRNHINYAEINKSITIERSSLLYSLGFHSKYKHIYSKYISSKCVMSIGTFFMHLCSWFALHPLPLHFVSFAFHFCVCVFVRALCVSSLTVFLFVRQMKHIMKIKLHHGY